MSVQVQKNVSLQPFNTMAVPAKASHFYELTSPHQIQPVIDFSKANGLSILVIGEGSNTIFTQDYSGLVVLNRLRGITVVSQDSDNVTVKVAAGENWHNFVESSIQHGWLGLENLALIPGLVGAAPIQNIGAYGVDVKESIVEVELVNLTSAETSVLTNADCQFAYRDSVFKHELRNKVIITAVTFKLQQSKFQKSELQKKSNFTLTYPVLNSYLLKQNPNLIDQDHISAEQVFEAVCAIRRSKLPLPSDIPNTGSFFKNPIVTADKQQQLLREYPDLVSYQLTSHQKGEQFKLAAGWLIETAGWKNKSINNVSVHQQQALVITNPKHQQGKDVISYAIAIQTDIKQKFGVELDIEPQIY